MSLQGANAVFYLIIYLCHIGLRQFMCPTGHKRERQCPAMTPLRPRRAGGQIQVAGHAISHRSEAARKSRISSIEGSSAGPCPSSDELPRSKAPGTDHAVSEKTNCILTPGQGTIASPAIHHGIQTGHQQDTSKAVAHAQQPNTKEMPIAAKQSGKRGYAGL